MSIFGNSAGGASVSLLGFAEEAAGLFTGSVALSGSALAYWVVNEDPVNRTAQLAHQLHCQGRPHLCALPMPIPMPQPSESTEVRRDKMARRSLWKDDGDSGEEGSGGSGWAGSGTWGTGVEEELDAEPSPNSGPAPNKRRSRRRSSNRRSPSPSARPRSRQPTRRPPRLYPYSASSVHTHGEERREEEVDEDGDGGGGGSDVPAYQPRLRDDPPLPPRSEPRKETKWEVSASPSSLASPASKSPASSAAAPDDEIVITQEIWLYPSPSANNLQALKKKRKKKHRSKRKAASSRHRHRPGPSQTRSPSARPALPPSAYPRQPQNDLYNLPSDRYGHPRQGQGQAASVYPRQVPPTPYNPPMALQQLDCVPNPKRSAYQPVYNPFLF